MQTKGRQRANKEQIWKLPLEGHFKVNTDAAI